jgi:hypothetical protein
MQKLARKRRIAEGGLGRAIDGPVVKGVQVWQPSYFARPITRMGLLMVEIHYLEGNAVRAGITEAVAEYEFSSACTRDQMDLDMLETEEFWEDSVAGLRAPPQGD